MNEMHVVEDLAAYVLGALEPLEAARLEAHLKVCETCQKEWVSYRETAGLLALSVPPQDPRPELKEKILFLANQNAATKYQSVPGFWSRFTPNNSRILFAWSIVSLILIAVLGASNILLWGRLQTQQAEFLTVQLEGTDLAPAASALIVVPQDRMVGTLVIDNLSELDEALQYQLWLIRDGQRTSGAVFSMDEDAYKVVYLHLPDLLNTYDSFGITIEPAGGSNAPTGEKVMQGSL